MGDLIRMAAAAEQRLDGDPARLRAFADEIAHEAAARSLLTQISTGLLCSLIRTRADQITGQGVH